MLASALANKLIKKQCTSDELEIPIFTKTTSSDSGIVAKSLDSFAKRCGPERASCDSDSKSEKKNEARNVRQLEYAMPEKLESGSARNWRRKSKVRYA